MTWHEAEVVVVTQPFLRAERQNCDHKHKTEVAAFTCVTKIARRATRLARGETEVIHGGRRVVAMNVTTRLRYP